MGADVGRVGTTRRRVLVVDDDARVRQALRVLIDSSDGLCCWGLASSGFEAVAADEELEPDVVLLDLLLPAADQGLEALAALVARGRPVVALSIRRALGPAAIEVGAVAFVERAPAPTTSSAPCAAPDANRWTGP